MLRQRNRILKTLFNEQIFRIYFDIRPFSSFSYRHFKNTYLVSGIFFKCSQHLSKPYIFLCVAFFDEFKLITQLLLLNEKVATYTYCTTDHPPWSLVRDLLNNE